MAEESPVGLKTRTEEEESAEVHKEVKRHKRLDDRETDTMGHDSVKDWLIERKMSADLDS